MSTAFTSAGGTVRLGAKVDRVVVENRVVRGLELADGEVIEADAVVVTAPVWNLPQLFDEGVLPWDLLERIRLLRKNGNRACWIGYWIAAEEPVIAMTEREMASFFATPRTGLPGFTLNFTGYDPSVSPDGEYLTCVGAAFDAVRHHGDRAWIDRKLHELWLDIEDMLPMAKHALWKRPHLVTTYGVVNKPGLVGAMRPDAVVPGLEGLVLAGDTTRARGVGIEQGRANRDHGRRSRPRNTAPVLRRHRPLLNVPRGCERRLPTGSTHQTGPLSAGRRTRGPLGPTCLRSPPVHEARTSAPAGRGSSAART